MLVKCLRMFRYAPDGQTLITIAVGDDVEIADRFISGLIAEGFVEMTDPGRTEARHGDNDADSSGQSAELTTSVEQDASPDGKAPPGARPAGGFRKRGK